MKPTKQQVFEYIRSKGSVRVVLDPRLDGVVVPQQFRKDPTLTLQFGDSLKPPLQDFDVTEGAVSARLTFKGVPEYCVVPWRAVYFVGDTLGRGIVWDEDVPREMRTKPKPRTERHLRLVR